MTRSNTVQIYNIISLSDIFISMEHMGKMLEDGKNVQSLAVIVLDVFLYNFWTRHNINKHFFYCEKWVFARPTVKISYILDDFKGQSITPENRVFFTS